MKIVITEGGHSTNVGSMALIENAIRIARTANPDVSISVFCSDAQGVDSFLKHDGEDKNVKCAYREPAWLRVRQNAVR